MLPPSLRPPMRSGTKRCARSTSLRMLRACGWWLQLKEKPRPNISRWRSNARIASQQHHVLSAALRRRRTEGKKRIDSSSSNPEIRSQRHGDVSIYPHSGTCISAPHANVALGQLFGYIFHARPTLPRGYELLACTWTSRLEGVEQRQMKCAAAAVVRLGPRVKASRGR